MASKITYICDYCKLEYTHNSHFIKIYIPSIVSHITTTQGTYQGDEVCSETCGIELLKKVREYGQKSR